MALFFAKSVFQSTVAKLCKKTCNKPLLLLAQSARLLNLLERPLIKGVQASELINKFGATMSAPTLAHSAKKNESQ